jgi:branched-chain amino acid transport system permease protein
MTASSRDPRPDQSALVLVYTVVSSLVAMACIGINLGPGLQIPLLRDALSSIQIVQTLAFLAFVSSLLLAVSLKTTSSTKLIVFLFILLLAVPIIGVSNTQYLDILVNICIYAALALGLNVVVGFAGLLDLGYAAFFAVGAYLWAIFGSPQANEFIAGGGFPLNGNFMFLMIPIAVVVAAGFGALLGLPVLKVKGDYLAIITLGLGEVIRVLANNLNRPVNITNGSQGVRIPPGSAPLEGLLQWISTTTGIELFKLELLMYYLVVLLVVGIAIILTSRLDNSKIGRAWVAIREDEIAAQAMGVPLVRTKLIAFATGASFAGAMGVLYAAKFSFVSPESFNFQASISILAMVVLGGLGSIQGVILGAAIVIILNQMVLTAFSNFLSDLRRGGLPLPNQFEPAQYQQLIYGIILIVMMIVRPKGLIPAQRNAAKLENLEHGELAKGGK